MISLALDAHDASRRDDLDLGLLQTSPQRRAHDSVHDHMTELIHTLFACIDAREPEATFIRYVDAPDRCGFTGDQGPDTETLEDATAAIRQCRGAFIEARLIYRPERMRLNEGNLEVELRERHSERRADEAAAANRHIMTGMYRHIATSVCSHQLFNLLWRLRKSIGEDLIAIAGHGNVVLDTNADVPPLLRHTLGA
jgi:hypothetical protein